MSKKKDRKVNTDNFPTTDLDKTHTSAGDYSRFTKALPKKYTEFKRVEAVIDKIIEDAGTDLPKGVSPLRLEIFLKAREIALREPFEDITRVKCPVCKQYHPIVCQNENCGASHEIKVPNAAMEKNSVSMLLKYMDKFAPNLAAVTQDINVNFLIQNISEYITTVITRYVPGRDRERVISEFKTKMIETADFEEVNEKQDQHKTIDPTDNK